MAKTLAFPLPAIPDEGLDVRLDLAEEDLEGGLWFKTSGLRLAGRLTRSGLDEARFEGRLSGNLLLECSLGLAEFSQPFDEAISVYFARRSGDFDAPEVELKERDMELAFIEDEAVDLTGAVRDQIALEIPIQPKCPGECLGESPEICKRPGEGESAAPEAGPDPRWAGLKNWAPPGAE